MIGERLPRLSRSLPLVQGVPVRHSDPGHTRVSVRHVLQGTGRRSERVGRGNQNRGGHSPASCPGRRKDGGTDGRRCNRRWESEERGRRRRRLRRSRLWLGGSQTGLVSPDGLGPDPTDRLRRSVLPRSVGHLPPLFPTRSGVGRVGKGWERPVPFLRPSTPTPGPLTSQTLTPRLSTQTDTLVRVYTHTYLLVQPHQTLRHKRSYTCPLLRYTHPNTAVAPGDTQTHSCSLSTYGTQTCVRTHVSARSRSSHTCTIVYPWCSHGYLETYVFSQPCTRTQTHTV